MAQLAESSPFLRLFPHRYDYLWAEHSAPDQRPQWRTETRHPLSDRLVMQSAYLYGVRFGPETNYCLLDIDPGSPYHPDQDALAIPRLMASLEDLGLVSYVACRSSYRGGIHLYLPFPQSQSSWCLAIAVASVLENAGFKLIPGQLELFPDPKPFCPNRRPGLFKGHRLPLQAGSYLLDADFQPIWSDQQRFVEQWQLAQSRNVVERQLLRRIVKQVRRPVYGVSGTADKFINDLNAEIELGWTGPGQTNRLLGRIAMRAYIFQHLLTGGLPLEGEALVQTIVATAQALPGYRDWCQHQHELEQRAIDWARCIEKSRYFHYGLWPGHQPTLQVDNPAVAAAAQATPTWNQHQTVSARERIRSALAHMLEAGTLPVYTTARFKALVAYGIGGSTLYRHRDLWHPQAVEFPPAPPTKDLNPALDLADASNAVDSVTLFPPEGRNPLPHQVCTDLSLAVPAHSGRNSETSSLMEHLPTPPLPYSPVPSPLARVRQLLAHLPKWHPPALCPDQPIYPQQEIARQKQSARMHAFLRSGDPILMAEARIWLAANPQASGQGGRDGNEGDHHEEQGQ